MERSLIDLGTRPLGHTVPSAELDADRMDYLVEALGIVELPVVLDVFPRFDRAANQAAALRRGHDGLDHDGLLPDGRVHPDLEMWLRVLDRPRWFIAARLINRPFTSDSSMTRIALASNESGSVLAVASGGWLRLRASVGDPAQELLDALGVRRPFEFHGIAAETDLLAEALDGEPTDRVATSARLSHIGIEDSAAADVAAAMSTCSAHAEITSVTVGPGVRTVGQNPVAFFDTRRGRIVATSSMAADGRQWTSLSPGSDGRVRSAIEELIAGTAG
ncbi:ESX secretion-associated protein EspG [Rhodococcus sp. 1168]|uniref:ESX secretion-associated protein EspG n=1 Tax=Rhodococcus sp. 1168 TaxID=2018041 RepID=UPI0020CB2273|nr:ESX secretion-associated protein EspG [Rhodococcus sp. 1168]